ncbi:MAG: LapA family protein, partial [Mycobacteriaceae bacterium]
MQTDPSHPEDAPSEGERAQQTPDPAANGASTVAPQVRGDTGPELPEGTGSARARKGPLEVTRTASAWIGLVVGALILILLLVFVLQNNENTKLSILVWDFTLPLGVSMLVAAIAGALIMALAGGARILQLRKAYKNH